MLLEGNQYVNTIWADTVQGATATTHLSREKQNLVE